MKNKDNAIFKLNENDNICFSILITGKCNISCSYCHYYAYQKRSEVNFNLSKETFEKYVKLIKFTKNNFHENIQVRFSGGEPLSSGNLLFEYSKILYNEVGIKPFILTNGKMIDDEIIKKSKDSHVNAFVISLENPFDIDKNSVHPEQIIKIINEYNSSELPLIPGIVIVSNDHFKNLLDICDYYYNRINQMPSFLTLDFSFFKRANDKELSELKFNLKKVLEKYYSVVPLSLFGYVVPELATGYKPFYIAELDLINSKNISGTDLEDDLILLQKSLNEAYFPFYCPMTDCDWHSNCRKLKWVWKTDMKGYCNLKKTISSTYYDFAENK